MVKQLWLFLSNLFQRPSVVEPPSLPLSTEPSTDEESFIEESSIVFFRPKPQGDPPEVSAPPIVEDDLDPQKKQVIWSILSVFETGKPEADYGAVAVLSDGAGISYGKHQSTDRSGSLDAIVLRYLDIEGPRSTELRPFLENLEKNDTTTVDPKAPVLWPDWMKSLMKLLEELGQDPVMQRAQDEVFTELYWLPAKEQAKAMQLVFPLSWCAVYDSTIHSGPTGVANIRKRFPEKPPSGGGDEKAWTKAYLVARRDWLASHSHPLVRSTVYRMDALLKLVEQDNWELALPISIDKPRATIS